MKILFIGDISGKMGRRACQKLVPDLKKRLDIDLVIANVENSAHGSGVTERTLDELKKAQIDWMTNGDHAFRRVKQLDVYDKYNIIRPANFSANSRGKGYVIIETEKINILLINLIGRVFMRMDHDCPFYKLDEILAKAELPSEKKFAIIIDMHAETTSEKVSMGHYANGRVSAMLGTHTHVMTADHKVTSKGTAYITDVGMVGDANGCIGLKKEGIIKTFLDQIKYPHEIAEEGEAIFNSVLLTIDDKTGKAEEIQPITKFIKI